MKNEAVVEQDGHLTIPADVLERAGFQPGDRVHVESATKRLVIAPDVEVSDVFERWRGIDRTSPPRSVEELEAEAREMRGHDDLN